MAPPAGWVTGGVDTDFHCGTPTADIRVGYAACAALGQVLHSQVGALTKYVPVG
ncbi:hypothetical protein ACIF80_36415 [Streptomyces sp. NPDC085927]|uniref:hypothetical protein n=1 Tax=Streptomyces sp. NPDC085927 TaxID=3365738 RepID=UPI0037D2BD57